MSFSVNPKLKNGYTYHDISDIVDKYFEVLSKEHTCLLSELTAKIGFEDSKLQKAAEENVKWLYPEIQNKVLG